MSGEPQAPSKNETKEHKGHNGHKSRNAHKAVRTHVSGELQVLLKEGFHGTNVLPVAVEGVCNHIHFLQERHKRDTIICECS